MDTFSHPEAHYTSMSGVKSRSTSRLQPTRRKIYGASFKVSVSGTSACAPALPFYNNNKSSNNNNTNNYNDNDDDNNNDSKIRKLRQNKEWSSRTGIGLRYANQTCNTVRFTFIFTPTFVLQCASSVPAVCRVKITSAIIASRCLAHKRYNDDSYSSTA